MSAQTQQSWYSTLDITSGLILHNTFDTDASDSSASGYDGTLTNGASIDTSVGTNQIGDGKLSLDGNNDYVDLSAHSTGFQSLTEGTIAAWVYARGSGFDVIFEVSDAGDNDSRAVLARGSNGQLNFGLFNGPSQLLDVDTPAGTVPLNTWTHVALTVDATGNVGGPGHTRF